MTHLTRLLVTLSLTVWFSVCLAETTIPAVPSPSPEPEVSSSDEEQEEFVFLERVDQTPVTILTATENAEWKAFFERYKTDLENWTTISDAAVLEVKTAFCKVYKACKAEEIKLLVLKDNGGVVSVAAGNYIVLVEKFENGACVNYYRGNFYACVEPSIKPICESDGKSLLGQPVDRVRGLGNKFIFHSNKSCADVRRQSN